MVRMAVFPQLKASGRLVGLAASSAHVLSVRPRPLGLPPASVEWARPGDARDAAPPCGTAQACRPVKCRQKAVAGGIDLATTMTRELVTNKGVMLIEKVFPSAVTEFDKLLGRLNNVRK